MFVYYSITALGASGGTGAKNPTPTRGAFVHANFNLTKGDKIYILIGQEGESACRKVSIALIPPSLNLLTPSRFLKIRILIWVYILMGQEGESASKKLSMNFCRRYFKDKNVLVMVYGISPSDIQKYNRSRHTFYIEFLARES